MFDSSKRRIMPSDVVHPVRFRAVPIAVFDSSIAIMSASRCDLNRSTQHSKLYTQTQKALMWDRWQAAPPFQNILPPALVNILGGLRQWPLLQCADFSGNVHAIAVIRFVSFIFFFRFPYCYGGTLPDLSRRLGGTAIQATITSSVNRE